MRLRDCFIWTERQRTEKVERLIFYAKVPGNIEHAVELIGKGVSLKPLLNNTPLLMHAAAQGVPAVVTALIKAGADIHFSNDNGATATSYAAMSGQTEALRVLFNAGAEKNRRNSFGATLLWTAMEHPETLRFLVAEGLDVNARDNEGRTPLMLGALYGLKPESLRTLYDLGAKFNAHDDAGLTAMDHAQRNSADRQHTLEHRNVMVSAMMALAATEAEKQEEKLKNTERFVQAYTAADRSFNVRKPLTLQRQPA